MSKGKNYKPQFTYNFAPGALDASNRRLMRTSAWDGGYDKGCADALRLAYAVAAITLNEEFGFGAQRIDRFINALDRNIGVHASDGEKEILEVEKRFGLRIRFRNDDIFNERLNMFRGDEE